MLDATVFCVTLAGASNKKMIELQKCLPGKKGQSKITWTKAESPLFEDKPERLRALIALGLGCGVFEGINQCGPKAIEKILASIENDKMKNNPSESITDLFESYFEEGLKKKK